MRAHDMSEYWRLVNVSGGRVTGTFWVQATCKRGAIGWVRAVDATVWVDDARTWGRMLGPSMTASVKDGKVDLAEHMISPDVAVREFVLERRADVEAAILAAAEAVDWAGGGRMSCPHGHPRCPCTPDLPREPPPPPHLTEMEDT